jgi:hypothetical protein
VILRLYVYARVCSLKVVDGSAFGRWPSWLAGDIDFFHAHFEIDESIVMNDVFGIGYPPIVSSEAKASDQQVVCVI